MELSRYLLVDIGNSRIKWASAGVRDSIRPEGEMATADFTPERAQAMAKEFTQHFAIIASVVPKLYSFWSDAFSRRLLYVTAGASGLQFDYPKPAEIGVDRLAAAAAVEADGPGPAIIIQCGTATAFTVLNAQGKVCGGAIAPGLHTQLASLTGAAALLPETELRVPEHFLARSTEDAIRSGVILNFRGGVKEIVRRLIQEMPASPAPRIVLTGGNASYLTDVLDIPCTLRPLLVFEGLRIIGTSTCREPLLYIEE